MADPFVAMNNTQAANQNEALPLFVEYAMTLKSSVSVMMKKART